MHVAKLQAISAATLKSLAENPETVKAETHPYFGFYDVNIFECPNFVMFTNNDCPRAHDILYGRRFEPQSMKIWCRLARQATGIVDIGAHVGVYSLAAAALRQDIVIHAFEPNPYAFARLRVHKLANGFHHIGEHTFAVGHENGTVNFGWVKRAGQISSGGRVVDKPYSNAEIVAVPMIALDNTAIADSLGAKPLVKIDVEGGEPFTIKGMQRVLALRPDIILETFNQDACDVINTMIAPLGYNVFKILEADEQIERQDRLMPANDRTRNFNQLITTRCEVELAGLLSGPPAA